MRTSSWWILLLALVLLLGLGVLHSQSGARPAPPMNDKTANALLKEIQQLIQHKDTTGLIQMLGDHSLVLGHRSGQLAVLIMRAFREAGPDPILFNWSDLHTSQSGKSAIITINIQVGQKNDDLRNKVQMGKFTVIWEKVTKSRFLGLFHAEEWKVAQVTSDSPVEWF